ncbi:hypothetical protein [Alkalibacterium sp. 20]|uniref:hypothetical protein n=1 Tax=Alkalibacterium sp. 20 TaxID=1798803 RepID=UPI0008FFFA53|nr:hypothetical protein [Alkalibacterium sp. 20]OJF93268.1 hypothetical protein AX762_09160 [Alkalibacterium sp. 20]
MSVTTLAVALGFTFIHIGSKHFKLRVFTVNQFTSFVGGISLSYVFFHLIPTIRTYEHEVMETFHVNATNASHVIFGSMLLGIIIFYFLEVALKSTRLKIMKNTQPSTGIFWAHIGSYFLYNFIIGMLLATQQFRSSMTATIYLVAIGLHFLTNDWVLRHHFRALYDSYGLKLLVLGVIAGYLLGANIHVSHLFVGLLEAFVAGGLMLNAIKDELPACRGNGLTSFMVGLSLYSVLLLSI